MSNPEDLLSDSLQSLYDYAPVSHSSAGSFFTYTYHGLSVAGSASRTSADAENSSNSSARITLRTPDTQPANWALHASSIWMSSLYLADHITDLHLGDHIQRARSRGETLHVLELGAGAGLPGILIARCYDQVQVISSDYPDEQLIDALAENVERNDVSSRCRAVPYAWGTDPTALLSSVGSPGFDVIVAADTLWNPDLHLLFVKSLSLTLRKSEEARVHLIAGLHTGRYTIQAFLRVLGQNGLVLEEAIEKEAHGTHSRPWNVEREETETEEDRRRWVVWVIVKWTSDDLLKKQQSIT